MTRSGPYFLMVYTFEAALVDLVPARPHEAAHAALLLVVATLGVVLDDHRPRVHRALRHAACGAPVLQQAAAHHRILHAVGAVQVPRVRGAARTASRLVVGQVRARARVVGLLGLPGDDAALHIHLPRARARAIRAVGRAHDLLVGPAVPIGIFPGAVLAGDDAMAAGEAFGRQREVLQSIEKVAHRFTPCERVMRITGSSRRRSCAGRTTS
jgi:hypothetical protein